MRSLKKHRALLALMSVITVAAFLPGCSTGPTLNTSAQNTPMAHPEAKVLFVKLRDGTTVLKDDVVDLKFGHKLVVVGEEGDGEDDGDALKTDLIERGDSFSIILNSVWIPEKLSVTGRSKTRDIAAILDIVLDDGDVEPVVVAYQREVQGDHLLNFKNIVVTSVEKWDGVHQPYFRLRILDVRSERNTNTQAMLEQASQMVNTVSGIVPTPYLPAVSKAIEASKYILGNKDNEILLDYRIQFFDLQQAEPSTTGTESVSKVLDPFYQGSWIAFGRPKEDGELKIGPEFWSSDFYYNRVTGMIEKTAKRSATRPTTTPPADQLESLSVPYVSVVVVKKNFGVSQAMKKAFAEMSQIITSGSDKTSSKEVKDLAQLLQEYADSLANQDEITAEVLSVKQAATNKEKQLIITDLTRRYTEFVNDDKWQNADYLKSEMILQLGLDVDALTTVDNPVTRGPSRVVNSTKIDALQFQ